MTRQVKTIQEVSYTLTPDEVRAAIVAFVGNNVVSGEELHYGSVGGKHRLEWTPDRAVTVISTYNAPPIGLSAKATV